MPFQITDEEKEKIEKLPKWAKDLVTRMGRVINLQESKINAIDAENPVSNVRIYKHNSEINLPNNSQVKYILRDSVMSHNDETYRNRNQFTVSVKDNIQSGENIQMLEIYSNDSLIIEHHSSNIIWIHPRNIIDSRFIGMDDIIEDGE